MSHDFHTIDGSTRQLVKDKLIRVKRRPSETDAFFIESGRYKILTSNGESFCNGPVWILWDTLGCPYPITPAEFYNLYVRQEKEE